jgi:hypothetical protein
LIFNTTTTHIYIDKLDGGAVDQSALLSGLVLGDIITIYDITGSGDSISYTVQSTPTIPSGTTYDVDTAYLSATGSGSVVTGAGVRVCIQKYGGGGGGGLGIILPVPNVKLARPENPDNRTINAWDESNNVPLAVEMANVPYVITDDLDPAVCASGNLYIEMVQYRRKYAGKGSSSITLRSEIGTRKKSGYVISMPSTGVQSVQPGYLNTSAYPWINKAQRGGAASAISYPGYATSGMNRYNWRVVDAYHTHYNMKDTLNAKFIFGRLEYRDAVTGTWQQAPALYPTNAKSGYNNRPTSRFAYSTWYMPFRIAFRYIYWDDSTGMVLSGPLSRVIVVTTYTFNFPLDVRTSAATGLPHANFNPKNNDLLNCQFETRLPTG